MPKKRVPNSNCLEKKDCSTFYPGYEHFNWL